MGAVVSMGEQKIGPFPHWTMSYETPGQRFSHVSIPASDWYVGTEVPGAIEWGHTIESMQAAVDFYYTLGASIELYGHIASIDGNLIGEYVKYCAAKPRMWAASAVGISDWWQDRTNTMVTPSYTRTGNTVTSLAMITGATSTATAIEVAIPNWSDPGVSNIQVFINNALANPADYRTVGNAIKVRVGTSASSAKVQYTINTVNNPLPTTTGLSPVSASAGGAGFTLTVNGTGFINGSVVQWNGSNRATTYVSANQLSAAIPSADIAAAGTTMVAVFTPAPGGGTSNAQTFTINDSMHTWTQTDWSGGAGQVLWADATLYNSASGVDTSISGQLRLAATNPLLFTDDFTRSGGTTLSPWVASMGTWTVTGGVLRGTGSANQYSYASMTASPQWTDYTLQGRIQLPAGSFGGGIGGRVNASTGAHYGAWVYPAGSPGGSNLLKLWKFRSWTDIGPGVPMQQVSLTAVGTGWHTLQMTFTGNRIQVYYDGVLKIDVTDNNFDSRAPYPSGGISADWWTWSLPYTIIVDDISVATPSAFGSSGTLLSSAYDGGDGVQWQTLSWDATAGPGTNVCLKTRTADVSDQLASAAWSNCYSTNGSTVLSENRRWIQYQLALSTSDTSTSPVFNEIRTTSLSGSLGALPTIISLAPTSSTAGDPGLTLTVMGTGFINGSTIQWNGANRTTTYVSATQLTAAILASDLATAGTATVTVFTPAPGGGTSNALTFTITVANNPVPTTTTISPVNATAGGSAFTLTVNGNSFINGSLVQWNGASRTTTYVSTNQLTAAILASDLTTTGTATVTVFTPAPGGGTSNALTFTINVPDNPVPATTGISPVSATAGSAGFTLTVNGNSFINGSSVQWNGSNRATTYVSATQLTAAILASDVTTTGTATITVFTPAPGGGTSNAQTFVITVPDNPVPATTSISPVSTTAGGSAFTLTVNGNSFINGSSVQWNGASRTTTYVSTNQLTTAILASDLTTTGTATVTVFTPAPGGGTSNAQIFTITVANNPVPTTTGLSPVSATAGGTGFTLTVNGNSFINGSSVQWNGSNRTTTYVSTNQLTAAILTSDLTTTGTATVTVFTPAPGGGTSNAQAFVISVANNPAPLTTSLNPTTATAGSSGFTLTVNGNSFINGSTIQWNGSNRATTYVSATQLTAAILASDLTTTGTATVTVFTPAPGGGTSNVQTFTITVSDNPVPATASISPVSATAGGSAFTLTVNGNSFINGSSVQWNGASRTTTYVSTNQLTAAILASDLTTTGTATVTVFTPAPGGGTSNAQTFTITIANNPVPLTTSISPVSGTAGGTGFTLTVNGNSFINGSSVQWNGSNRTTTYVSATQLTAAILASDLATAGTATVTVFTPAPGGGTSNAQIFTITVANNPAPLTTSLNPTTATAGSAGFTLTVNGSSFINGSTIQWNGSNRATTDVSTNQLTAAILASDLATAGTATVTVFTPAPGGGTSNAQTFVISAANNPAPTTTSLDPTTATAGSSGFTLTVNGNSFINGSSVQWNGSNRTTTYVSATQLTAAILASDLATAGTATVTVFTPAPGGGTSNAQTFTITIANNPVPLTTSISPVSGTAGGTGFTLTVNGNSFINGSSVQWNGSNRTTTYVSATQLTAAILASDLATAGTATVTVFTPAPGGGTSNAQIFTITVANNPAPTTTSISPVNRNCRRVGFHFNRKRQQLH